MGLHGFAAGCAAGHRAAVRLPLILLGWARGLEQLFQTDQKVVWTLATESGREPFGTVRER